ncbi:MAG: hypothetical protein ACREC5_08550, partial [Thermoplasmata archaeon]
YYLDQRPESRPPTITERPPELSRLGASSIEGAFLGNPIAREALLVELDVIERTALRPDLPSPTVDELRRITTLPPAEFRSYVATRVDRLERGL